MNNNNNITDKDIRDLLKRRLLEQEEDGDLLTQKLTDMEAKLVFSDEALVVPSLQKEKEFIKKITKNNRSSWRWLFAGIALLIVSFIIYHQNRELPLSVAKKVDNTQFMIVPDNKLPEQKTDAVVLTDSAFAETRIVHLKEQEKDSTKTDTLKNQEPEKWTAGDAGIKVEYKARKHDPKFVDAYDHIPTLSEKEIALTKKFKDRMIKQLLKKDKNAWAYIPMSTDVFSGDTLSMNAFYISTSEVTNNQYRTFLNDLLIQGKVDEYVKAVPDTSKWISEGRALFYKLQPDSTKWPGGVEVYFGPMTKNYYWHPAYDSYPVVNVSRDDAKLYCDWLTNAVNEKIKNDNTESKWNSLFINDLRIPQDAEWMMAARGGHGSVDYPWSGRIQSPKGAQNANGCYLANFCIRNYKEQESCPNKKIPDAYTSAGSVSLDYRFVAPVMSYNPNDYNLYCMAGNVAEMVWMRKTGKAGTKGGSWGSDSEHIKIDAEDEYAGITEGSMYIGFRPVFTATKKTANKK